VKNKRIEKKHEVNCYVTEMMGRLEQQQQQKS
jgi:hypothetical protein